MIISTVTNQKARVSRRDMPTSDAPITTMRIFSVTFTSKQMQNMLNINNTDNYYSQNTHV